MTPDQENELVARWVGWKKFQDACGYFWWNRIDIPNALPPYHYTHAPPYRTDPALLWELMERLLRLDWKFVNLGTGLWTCRNEVTGMGLMASQIAAGKDDDLGADTLAEAVFAAAVIQAQEGK